MKFQSSHDWRKILSDVHETRLDNGLTGLVLPCPGIATVVSDIYYAGGSASDPQGRFGLTHFLEHMLFNGTQRVPKGMLDRVILRLAGQHNAETGPDFTHFWCQVPKHALELALALEADRMTGARLDDDDLQRERTIIIEEEARYREQPFDELMMRLIAEIYAGHPYAHPTIGTPNDLKAIDTNDLRAHYQHTFQPANAVLVLAGDFRPGLAIELIHKQFGPLTSISNQKLGQALSPPSTAAFDGRRILVDSNEVVPRGALLWPAPGPFDLNTRAWGVATAILGGGRSSRLWQALVDEHQMAAYVSVSLSEERLGGYLMIDLELNPETDPDQVEAIVFEVLENLAKNGPTPDEVRRAAVQRSSAARWARQQSATMASALGTWSLFADWHMLGEAWRLDDLVTAADVQGVAMKLGRSNSVRGWTVPSKRKKSPPGDSSMLLKPDQSSHKSKSDAPLEIGLDTPLQRLFKKADRAGIGFKPRSWPVKHPDLAGMSLVTESLKDKSVCSVELRWRTGWLEEAVPGLGSITARVCEELTDPETGKPFVELFEELGGSLETGSTGFSVQGLGEDLGRILKLLQRMIWAPKWSAETLRRVAQRTRTELRADLDDPSFQAELLWRRLVYAGQPGQEDSRGTLESLKQINLTAVRGHHARFYRPDNAILGVVGHFRRDRVSGLIERKFLMNAGQPIATPATATLDWAEMMERPLPAPQELNMRSPGTQTHLVLGHRTLPRTHPDWVAMQALEVILGSGPGLTDLLTRRLRDELGLVYAVSLSTAEGAWRSPGALRVGFSCDPADAARAEAETIQILKAAASGELTDEDCNEARDYLARSWSIAYEAADDRMACWLDTELEGWDLYMPPAWVRTCLKLTPDVIRNTARRWIRPELLQIVRFGP